MHVGGCVHVGVCVRAAGEELVVDDDDDDENISGNLGSAVRQMAL